MSENLAGSNHPSKPNQSVASATDGNERVALPPIILRLLAERGRRKGLSAEDFYDLYGELASAVSAADIIDHFGVLDVTEATFDIQWLRQSRHSVVERMRERRCDELAISACATAAMQRDVARYQRIGFEKFIEGIDDPEAIKERRKTWTSLEGEIDPPSNAPPYGGAYSEADIAKFAKPLDSATDDGQAFLDSLDALEAIEGLIEAAQKRRDQALKDIFKRRRNLGERLRENSDRLIEMRTNPDRRGQ